MGKMDSFCGGEWGPLVDEEFTPCFLDVAIMGTPVAFIVLFGLTRLISLLARAPSHRPAVELSHVSVNQSPGEAGGRRRGRAWSGVFKAKLAVSVAEVGLALALLGIRLSFDESPADYEIVAPAVNAGAWVIGTALLYVEHASFEGSIVLPAWWCLQILLGAWKLRFDIEDATDRGALTSRNVIFFAQFFLFLVAAGLTFVGGADSDDPEYELKTQFGPNSRSPEETAGIISRLTFWWLNPLVVLGYKRPLEMEDLWPLAKIDQAPALSDLFQKYWSREVNDPKPSLSRAFRRCFGVTFLSAAVYKLINDVCQFVGPQILNLLVEFVEEPDDLSLYWGYVYAGILLGSALLQSIVLHQYFHICFRVGMQLRAVIVTAVYQKSLRLSSSARQMSTTGAIVNLMSVDAQRFMELTPYVQMTWSAPFQIALSLYFLWDVVDYSLFAGLFVMLVMIPLNGLLAARLRRYQKQMMKHKDSRTKILNEVLNGIKVIKLYAWEVPFLAEVTGVRDAELATLKSAKYLSAVSSFLWHATPMLVAMATFTMYALLDNTLTASKAFTALALFNILRFPLTMLPMVIASLVDAAVSLNRLRKFLLLEELDPDAVQRSSDRGGATTAILVRDATFSWQSPNSDSDINADEGDAKKPLLDEDDAQDQIQRSTGPVLEGVSVRVDFGELVTVVGQVASGKSSLLEAILGGLYKLDGDVQLNGTVAYAPQQAWIQNATLRDNITFGSVFDPVRYEQVVRACALLQDIEMLPAGDQTEIGEKGINLSGGQKQRVSLARACYQDADVYILDDVLSAVDAHVGKHIFDNVIGPAGMLKSKARLFVTHGTVYLPQTTRIVALKDGRVAESGTYSELMSAGLDFATLVNTHAAEPQEQSSAAAAVGDDAEGGVATKKAPVPGEGDKDKAFSDVVKGTQANKGQSLMTIEDRAFGSVDFSVYKSYAQAIGVGLAIAVIISMILQVVGNIATNIWLSVWTGDAEFEDNTLEFYLGIYVALGAANSLAVLAGMLLMAVASIIAARDLHERMLETIMRSPMSFFDTTPIGRILNRFGKEQYVVDDVLSRIIQQYMSTVFFVIGVIVVICLATPYFLVALIPLSLVYRFVQRYYLRSSRELKRLDSVSRSPVYSHFGESLNGVSTIRAYGAQDRFIYENERKLDINQTAYYPSIASNRWLAMRLEFVGTMIVSMACLFAVMERDNVDPGLVGLSISYALSITQTLNWAVRMSAEAETNIVSVERIKHYAELDREAAPVIPDRRPPAQWPSKGQIEFRNLEFRYRPGLDLVLKGISATIAPGEKVGICGRTGAGKSSLTVALFRLVEPAGGQILIDGVDICTMGLDDLRSRLSIIPQDPVLFSGTLRSNLDPFEQHSDKEVLQALERAHLQDLIKEGFRSPVAENGENYSVGQRQLICLARALLRHSKILVLDEATAAVDVETDALVQKTIAAEFKDCTVLTIAHRINTILDSDRIIVLDRGRVVEFDKPDRLLGDPRSVFASMVNPSG